MTLWKKVMYHDGYQFNDILGKSYDGAQEVITNDSLRTSRSNLLITLRVLLLGWTFFLAMYQFFFDWTDEWSSINTIYVIYLLIWVTFVVGLSYSIYFDNIDIVEPLFILMWVRFTLPLLDFEKRHIRDDDL